MQRSKEKSERGSSTLEFIFCAPLLIILMFIAMEINERIEQRVTSAIAAGNASWLADPNQMSAAGGPEAENLAKADVLGAHPSANNGILRARGWRLATAAFLSCAKGMWTVRRLPVRRFLRW